MDNARLNVRYNGVHLLPLSGFLVFLSGIHERSLLGLDFIDSFTEETFICCCALKHPVPKGANIPQELLKITVRACMNDLQQMHGS